MRWISQGTGKKSGKLIGTFTQSVLTLHHLRYEWNGHCIFCL